MNNLHRSIRARGILILFLTFLFINCSPEKISVNEYNPDVLIAWNKKLLEIAIAEDGLLTLKGLRTLSMMHIAVHDALNSLSPVYAHYSYTSAFMPADPIAVSAYALFKVSSHEYPDQEKILEKELEYWIKDLDKDELVAAKLLGEASALHILERRTNDGWSGEAEYTWHPMAPGVYAEFNEHSGTPEGFIFGAGWAKAQPFILPSTDHFRSPPPPAIESNDYTQAFKEVKEVGSQTSTSRTADQTHLALWWKDFVENSHNRLLRNLVNTEKLNLWEASRIFALMNMAVYDAYINVFDNKFHYNHWRPYTAIRWAEHDDNPNTQADTEWNNLHGHTYAFPSYPSAHGTASSAAMTVLAEAFGKGNDYSFTMETKEVDAAGPFSGKIAMDPPTRSFSSFSEAGMEASISRVYLGIHFRYDSVEGHRLGNEIGAYAAGKFLNPLN